MDTPPRDARLQALWATPPGLSGRLAAVNNQVIGIRFMVTAAIYFLLATGMALVMRLQLAVPENRLVGPEIYNQLFTMHGSTMMFLFIVPFLEGMALYLLPLVIGSRDVAFPRLTAFGYWTYFLGGLMLFVSFPIGQVPDAGWFSYTPLSGPRFAGMGQDLWLLGLGLIEVGGITAAAEIVVTILKLRAPGMRLDRMPLFAWAWFVTGGMILFAFTVLLVTTLMLELDRSAGTRFFDPEGGGSSLLWQHLFWFFGHPEVYIMFLPAVGMISMIIPVAAKRRAVAYTLLVTSFVVMGFVSFGLWAHHMFTTGLPWLSLSFFTAASLAIALAAGTQIYAWIATLWGSRPRFTVPLWYMIGFFLTFVVGGMTGVMVSVVPFDLQVHDTYFVVAHFHYVLIGGVVFPIMGAMLHWWPKFTGRMTSHALGLAGFWITFLGFNLTFFPMHAMGLLGMPRRVYTYPAELGLGWQNMLSTAGAFVLTAGFLVYMLDLWLSMRRGEPAGDNPWEADSLEWSVPSPSPIYNFYAPPIVADRHPLWGDRPLDEGPPDAARARAAMAGGPPDMRATLVTDALTGAPEGIHFLAFPSHQPLAAAVGLLIAAGGALFKWWLVTAFGAVVAAGAVVLWLWPRPEYLECLRTTAIEEASGLPLLATGSRSANWWGMVCLVAVVATVFAVYLYSYFYLWLYSPRWPQGTIEEPALAWPLLAYGLLVLSAGAQRAGAVQHAKGDFGGARAGAAAAALLAAGFVAVLAQALSAAGFSAQENAYASIFHVTSWSLALAAAVGAALNAALAARLRPAEGPLGRLAALQAELTAMYGYAVAAIGLVVFATLYVSPYVL